MDKSELIKLDNGKILCPKCSQTFLAFGSAKLHYFSCRNKKKPKKILSSKKMEDSEQEYSEDANKLWCICKQPDNFRLMICCDSCQHWYHGNCVGISKKVGKEMEETGVEWLCPKCKSETTKKSKRPWTRAYSTFKCEQNFDLNKNVEKTLNGNETIEIPDSDLYDSDEWDSSNEDENNDKTNINVENFNGTIEIPDADLYDSEEWDSSNADENLNTTINLVSSEFSFNEQTATPESRALLSSFGTDDYAKKHNDDENYVQQNHTNRFPPKKMGKEKLQTDEEDDQEGVEVIEDEVDDGYQKAEQNTYIVEQENNSLAEQYKDNSEIIKCSSFERGDWKIYERILSYSGTTTPNNIDAALDIDSDDGQIICWLCPTKFSDYSEAKRHFENIHAWEHLTESLEEKIILETEEEHNEINEEDACYDTVNAKKIPKDYRICNICSKEYHWRALSSHHKACQRKNAGKELISVSAEKRIFTSKETSNEDIDLNDPFEDWIEPTDTPYDMDFALAIYEKGRGHPNVLCMRCCTTLSNFANAKRHFINLHTVRRLKRSK